MCCEECWHCKYGHRWSGEVIWLKLALSSKDLNLRRLYFACCCCFGPMRSTRISETAIFYVYNFVLKIKLETGMSISEISIWCKSHNSPQEFEWLEFFAGKANLTRAMASAHYTCQSFDLLYNEQPKDRKSNFMDLTHASGFALLCCHCFLLLFSFPW